MSTDTGTAGTLTIDELAAAAGTTTRRVRSFQTMGLLPRPALRGRTGLYGPDHLERLHAILRLQGEGFSLESLGVLFDALTTGRSLAGVLGLPEPVDAGDPPLDADTDTAELYGFAQLQPVHAPGGRRPLLSLVPTTMWDESEAS
jgi:DNA-binding transcriptional MerR regulator